MDALSEENAESMNSEPHLRRVGLATPPPNFRLSTSTTSTSESVPSTPPIPPRSPLRPAARKPSLQSASLAFDSASDTTSVTAVTDTMPLPLLHSRSFGTMSGFLDTRTLRPKTPEKPLPIPPDSVISLVSLDDDELDVSPSTSARSSSLLQTPAITQSKRTYALLELLSSERAYASDLALIRDIHIPLALGNQEAATFVHASLFTSIIFV